MDEKHFSRRALSRDLQDELPPCYGNPAEFPNSHPQCKACKILEICTQAKNIPIVSYEDFHGLVEKVESGSNYERDSFLCPKSEDYVFFDEMEQKRSYGFDDMIRLIAYIFQLTPREFYFLQCKILYPHLTLKQIAKPLESSRQNISKRLQEILKKRPELFNTLRIYRHASTERPAAAKQNN